MVESKSRQETPLDDLMDNGSPTEIANVRMVTRQDGSQVPFSDQILLKYLANKLEGLNRKYINLDLIVGKVKQGIYNGKSLLDPSLIPIKL